VGFNVKDQLWISFFCILHVLEKKLEHNERVHQLFIDFKMACDSVRREVLYNILTEFGVHIKLIRLIEIYLNKTCNNVPAGRRLSDTFPIQMGYNKEMLHCHCFSEFL
jgi:hypothetical protein